METGDHSQDKQNSFGASLKEWWDSDEFKEMQKKCDEDLQKAIGKYFMLSEADKLDMLQAICHIMCKAESKGTSHRGLMDELGVYPSGFWVNNLMDVHNALWSYYHDKAGEEELQRDLDELQKFTENQKQS